MSNAESQAFPGEPYQNPQDGYIYYSKGLTKREYFAAMAMQGILSGDGSKAWTRDELAEIAVNRADALLKALDETK